MSTESPTNLGSVNLTVPAEPAFARSVRMMASNLAVVCGMGIDDVEDVRMAAEEGFVYCCATAPQRCDVSFALEEGAITIDFALGQARDEEIEASGVDLSLAELLLAAVTDDFALTQGNVLHVVKRAPTADGAHA
ncbi:hypothetical protein [Olsenella sp. HMSC062G07]|uniref:hypothetical protein n=1 Tax=Olsenella sp. HMSC062G07 TaxID=1739330 RepID=UPI0008A42B4B|nr:hypothetical protein [Olsenella sp. HMSC062G07]OFK24837.1 hypothetical protein HMPREF2826_06365 [Olsenella sp. HMSC062G07]